MSENICKNCGHFHQHYAFDKKKIFRVHCGHCTLGTAKSKRPTKTACDAFSPAPPDEDAFASKEYLSKELLQYLLSLELLPPIADEE